MISLIASHQPKVYSELRGNSDLFINSKLGHMAADAEDERSAYPEHDGNVLKMASSGCSAESGELCWSMAGIG